MLLVTDIVDGTSAKAKKAERFGVPLVLPRYIQACVEANALLAVEAFAIIKCVVDGSGECRLRAICDHFLLGGHLQGLRVFDRNVRSVFFVKKLVFLR